MLRLRSHVLRWLFASLAFGLAGAARAQAPDAPTAAPPAPGAAEAPSVDAGAAPEPPAEAEPCPSHNLARGARVEVVGATGARFRPIDGVLAVEGTEWNSTPAIVLADPSSRLTIDLGKVHPIGALHLQGDNNDLYLVESSEDGQSFRLLWTAPATEVGMGLRSRWVKLPHKTRARYLRLSGKGGDGFYSISELQAFCEPSPKAWPPKLRVPPVKHGWDAIDNGVMVAIKGVTAGVGTLVLLLLWWWSRRKRPKWAGVTLKTALALIGVLSFANWWNLGHYHFDHYIHIWEHYHYYVGAKYPELRYSRIYECTAVADMEDGLRERVVKRKMRALGSDNKLGTTAEIVADPSRCKRHFSEARWQQFKKDIRFFRGRFSRDRWDQSQNDHGYNATPVWAIAGRIIAEQFELSWEQITRNGIIDSALLGLMWLVVWWAFGWQASCVALIWWGCNFPARYYWNGGSYLRFDWLVWLTVGVCFLKKRWHAAGGAALTYATLLRIFPGFVVAAIVLKALYRMGRERRFVLSREHIHFASGCIVAMAVLLPAGSWATNGFDAWGEFAENSKKHLKTALTNNMGLKTVMGYDPGTRAILMRNDKLDDPFEEWKAARSYYYEKSAPIFFGLILLFCFMLGRAGDRDEDWVAACLGTGLIALAAELTCYYYGFLLTYGLLWERRKLPGVMAAGLAGLTCWLSDIPWNDDHFGAMSLATAVVIVVVTAHAAFGPMVRPLAGSQGQAPGTPPAPPSPPAPSRPGPEVGLGLPEPQR